jgi:GntR family transcriptional repressor for pyruvate dehydrogenase complex
VAAVVLKSVVLTPKHQIRQPRVAEMVADDLRERILCGELEDGAMLPKLEYLVAEIGVSPPSIREAFRILETEGLVTVHRGNVGGAVVHQPQPAKAAYMLGLVLQSRAVSLDDVLSAIRQLEPACAASCASRPDRKTTVMPRLRAAMDAAEKAIDDGHAYVNLARQFHLELVAGCGNQTMSLVVGALESLWSAHVDSLAKPPARLGSFADRKTRLATVKEHEELYRLIAKGDARGAERATREHFSEAAHEHEPLGWQHAFDVTAVVSATLLRGD